MWDAIRTLVYAFALGVNRAFMGETGRGLDLPEEVMGRDRAGAREGDGSAAFGSEPEIRQGESRLPIGDSP